MPFRLKYAWALLQREVDSILLKVKWELALVFLDDIVYSKSVTENLVHVRTVRTLFQNTRVPMGLSKDYCFDSGISYLKQTIRPGYLAVDNVNCDAVRKYLPPGELNGTAVVCRSVPRPPPPYF